MWGELHARSLRLEFLPLLALAVLGPLLARGLVTRAIARHCGHRLDLTSSCAANIMGGLWNLAMPLGAMGYKAVFLRNRLGIDWREYTGHYGLSFLASLFASALLFLLLQLQSGVNRHPGAVLALGGALMILVLLLRPTATFWGRFTALEKFAPPFRAPRYLLRFLELTALHGCGLAASVLLYDFGFLALGLEPSWTVLAGISCAESVLFMVALVPGNLVLLEGTAGWVGSLQGLSLWSGALVAGLVRLANLLGLILCALPAAYLLRRRGASAPAARTSDQSEDSLSK